MELVHTLSTCRLLFHKDTELWSNFWLCLYIWKTVARSSIFPDKQKCGIHFRKISPKYDECTIKSLWCPAFPALSYVHTFILTYFTAHELILYVLKLARKIIFIVVIEYLAVLLRIMEVPDLNLVENYVAVPVKCWDNTLVTNNTLFIIWNLIFDTV